MADTRQTLIAVVDDATKQLLYAQLVAGGKSLGAIMTALRAVLERYGIPGALYTDRAGWAVYTPTSGTAPDRTKRTQVGRALARLGIEHIVSFSPQARGRSERANGTLQGRLVNDCGSPGSGPSPPRTATCARASSRTTMPALAAPRPIPQRLRARGRQDLDQILCHQEEPPSPETTRSCSMEWCCSRQTAGSAQLRRPAGPRSPAPRRSAFRLAGAPPPGVVYGCGPPLPRKGPPEASQSRSGQITCQTRAARSLVNDRDLDIAAPAQRPAGPALPPAVPFETFWARVQGSIP